MTEASSDLLLISRCFLRLHPRQSYMNAIFLINLQLIPGANDVNVFQTLAVTNSLQLMLSHVGFALSPIGILTNKNFIGLLVRDARENIHRVKNCRPITLLP